MMRCAHPGPTPASWATFSIMDATGDGLADVLQYNPANGFLYLLRSESSFSTFITLAGVGDAFTELL